VRHDYTVISYPASFGDCLTRVLEAGEGDDVVLLLHGAGSRADRWIHNVRGLAASGFHVYALDLPGHGFATKGPGTNLSPTVLAESLLRFVDDIGASSVTLVGTSFGGYVAAVATSLAPERVRALVMVGAIGLGDYDVEMLRTGAVRIATVEDDAIRQKLLMLVYDSALVTDRWVAEETRINTSPGAKEGLLEVGRVLMEGPFEPEVLTRVRDTGVPVLLVWGAEDRFVPASYGIEVFEQMPDAGLVLMDRAGHAPYYERPDEFNETFIAFRRSPDQIQGHRKSI
jgi:2-hydroxy-6-oxonona-2,4-dienedioate hydrolase